MHSKTWLDLLRLVLFVYDCMISQIVQEMVLACTYKAGTAEQALNQNEIQLTVLQVQKDQQDAVVTDAKERIELMKKVCVEPILSLRSSVSELSGSLILRLKHRSSTL